MQQFEIFILDEAIKNIDDIFDYIAYELKSIDKAIEYRFGLLEKIDSLKYSASIFAPSASDFLKHICGHPVYTINYKEMTIIYKIDANMVIVRRVIPGNMVL